MNDKEKDAYTAGFSAGWEYKIGNKQQFENPYIDSSEIELYEQWQRGFSDASERA